MTTCEMSLLGATTTSWDLSQLSHVIAALRRSFQSFRSMASRHVSHLSHGSGTQMTRFIQSLISEVQL